jgi:hypothetical protein
MKSKRRLCLSVLIAAVLLASCVARGERVNPAATFPLDKGTLSGTTLMAAMAPDAAAFELVLGTSGEALGSAPLYRKADYATNVMDISEAPILNKSTYWWKARSKGSDGTWGEWSVPLSFTVEWTSPAPAPIYSPAGGTYKRDQSVTIACKEKRAKIWYTTDGSEPTTASKPYSAAIGVAGDGSSLTIRAIAIAPGFAASAVKPAKYAIAYPFAATPSFSPEAGTYQADQGVTIASPTKGAEIRYTTDGSAPTKESALYSTAIGVAGDGSSLTIRAIAMAPGFKVSAEGRAAYAIEYELAAKPTFSPGEGRFAPPTRSSTNSRRNRPSVPAKAGTMPTRP